MKNLQKVKNIIRESRDILIACHINPDGDAIGSMLALGLGLQETDKNVRMVCKNGIPNIYHSLPGADKIQKDMDEKKYDLSVAVDCSSPDILGVNLEAFKKAKHILEIDHHELRESFGTIALIDDKAAANGEIVYLLLKSLKIKFSQDIAQNLLTSLIVETNSFRLPHVRDLTFKICAELMKTGLDFTKLTNMVYWAQRKESLLLTGICLSRCQFINDGQVAWAFVERDDFNEVNGLDEDIDAVPDIMRSVQGVKVSVLFREQDDKTLRVSLRSKGHINIAKVAKEYGGGGHYDVAGCFVLNDKNVMDELIRNVVHVASS